jgi:predicted metal-dependent peptidase
MRFAKVIGKCDPKLVEEARQKLSDVFLELSLGYTNKMNNGIGGDPLVFQLVCCMPHILLAQSEEIDELQKQEKDQEERIAKGEIIPDQEKIPEEIKKIRQQLKHGLLRTAATDGKNFYWSPSFVVSKSKMGLRMLVSHESSHALYMHAGRRGSRHPRLWNIAVDYKVNFLAMEDLRTRGLKDYQKLFTEHLGEYITLEEYASFLKDPFNPPPRLAHFNPTLGLRKMADPAYIDPYEKNPPPPMYYADHQLSDLMKRPENIYDYLLSQIPKCPKCGKLGKYKKPPEYKALQKQIKENEAKKKKEQEEKDKAEKKVNDPKGRELRSFKTSGKPNKLDPKANAKGGSEQTGEAGESEEHTHGPGETCDHNHEGEKGDKQQEPSCCGNSCPECGDEEGDSEFFDPFGGAGDTLDDHLDTDVSEEEIAKRISEAMDIAKKMAGQIPAGLSDELGQLIAPKITWQDIVRQQMTKKRRGYGRSDYTNPKRRPLFAGLYVPSKRDYHLTVLCAMDCSGSMSPDDIAFGLSQLQVIDEKGEVYLTSFDTRIYWDSMIKINKADKENLSKAKVVGRGGTQVGDLFREYRDHLDKLDMIIIVSDGFIGDYELKDVPLPDKNITVLWLVTSHNAGFKPPIGRVIHLHNE